MTAVSSPRARGGRRRSVAVGMEHQFAGREGSARERAIARSHDRRMLIDRPPVDRDRR